jgi:DnaJ-class molecular chaperone
MKMQKSLTSYDILNINDQVTQDDVHLAYRRLAKIWHPDRNHHANRDQATHNFKLLQAAYNDIKTRQARITYDEKIKNMQKTVIAKQNKVMNDNNPLRSFFAKLDEIFQ